MNNGYIKWNSKTCKIFINALHNDIICKTHKEDSKDVMDVKIIGKLDFRVYKRTPGRIIMSLEILSDENLEKYGFERIGVFLYRMYVERGLYLQDKNEKYVNHYLDYVQ